MWLSILFVVAGILLLGGGGDVLVRGCSGLSLRLRITPQVIGLTVMAVGTSFPELVTSIVAQLQESPDMSLGNIVGSNIFNIGAVLGFCAMFQPLVIHGNTVRLEWPFMFLASCALLLLARDGQLDLLEGIFFLVSFALFTGFMVRLARRDVNRAEAERMREAVEEAAGPPADRVGLARPIAYVVGGGLVLWLGAYLLIEGAKEIASEWVDERIIGVTVVAAGTGLPELVATFVAVLHKRTDMAVGNVIGSNICNILLVGGFASTVAPLTVNPQILHQDLWWMLGISLILGPLLRPNRLNRIEGAVIFIAYCAYVVLLFRAPWGGE